MATASAVQDVKDAPQPKDAQKFLMVALAQIQPSPTNPRQHYDQNGLLELAASIKSSGVRQPVLIRPLDARDWQERLERDPKSLKFELVVGERRWRASKLAGKLEIPALISPMSNAEALEVQVIENLQREDVHPLDEASGYKALLEKKPEPNSPQHTVDTIAARVGKSVGYVYARLKLLNLAPAALSAFQDGLITPGHAILIARLGMEDQVRALRACFDYFNDQKKTSLGDLVKGAEGEPIAEKKLREWIQEHVNLLLSKAPWKLDDAQLVPAAGACTDCPKHSGHNPALFADLVEKDAKDVCFDSACYHNKQQALVKVQLAAAKEKAAEAEEDKPDLLQLSEQQSYAKPKEGQALWKQGQWLPAAKGSCKHVQAGIIVKGENAGQRKSVCTEPGCKVHKKQLYSSPGGGGSTSDYRAQQESLEWRQHKERVVRNKRAVARFLLARAVIKNVRTALPTEFLRVLAESCRPDENTAELVGEKKLNIAGASPAKLHQILVAAAAERFVSTAWGDKDAEQRRDLIHLAKLFKVDGKKILTSADKQIAAAQSCRECGCIAQAACEYWNGSKHVCCSWKEKDLCSNPKCLERAAKKAGPEKKAKAAKAKVGAK